jgi:hypothetical protein
MWEIDDSRGGYALPDDNTADSLNAPHGPTPAVPPLELPPPAAPAAVVPRRGVNWQTFGVLAAAVIAGMYLGRRP